MLQPDTPAPVVDVARVDPLVGFQLHENDGGFGSREQRVDVAPERPRLEFGVGEFLLQAVIEAQARRAAMGGETASTISDSLAAMP